MTRRKLEGRVGGLAFLVVLAILVPHRVETAKKFSQWSVPVNLGPLVNSAFEEFLPEISSTSPQTVRAPSEARISGFRGAPRGTGIGANP